MKKGVRTLNDEIRAKMLIDFVFKFAKLKDLGEMYGMLPTDVSGWLDSTIYGGPSRKVLRFIPQELKGCIRLLCKEVDGSSCVKVRRLWYVRGLVPIELTSERGTVYLIRHSPKNVRHSSPKTPRSAGDIKGLTVCQNCKTQFVGNNSSQKFCSQNCRQSFFRKKRRTMLTESDSYSCPS